MYRKYGCINWLIKAYETMPFILLLCYKLYFDLKFEFILSCLDSEMLSCFLLHLRIYWKLRLQGGSIDHGQDFFCDCRGDWITFWNLKLGFIKLFLSHITTTFFLSASSRNNLGKVVKDILDYAIRKLNIYQFNFQRISN